MLQAMNTGHEGSMTTIHANSPRDSISRLEQMIGMSGIDIPERSSRSQISSAINIVVQISRLLDGKRRLISVSEITGMEGEVIQLQEIFRFKKTGVAQDGAVEGHFEATGILPRFLDVASAYGVNLSSDIFRPDRKFT